MVGDYESAPFTGIANEIRMVLADLTTAVAKLETILAETDELRVGPAATPSEGYISLKELLSRVPYKEQTIRNLLSAGVFREGEHYFKRRGRLMFSWPAMKTWVESHGAQAVPTIPLVRTKQRGR